MKNIFPLLICVTLLYACAAQEPSIRKESGEIPASAVLSTHQAPSAQELFRAAATLLTQANNDASGQDQRARELLHQLLLIHSDSPWRLPAETVMLMIDRRQACVEKLQTGFAGSGEIYEQKVKCEEAGNRCREELTRILQENEQLKKDLQDLKDLEIEREQRSQRLR
jgi:hypothetical protein